MYSIKIYRKWLYIPSQIELIITETNELLWVTQNGAIITSEKHQSITHDNDTIAKQTLYVKQKFNISNSAY